MPDRVFYYPPAGQFNEYAKLTISTIVELGYAVEPIPGVRRWSEFHRRHETVAVLNWFEDQLAWEPGNHNKALIRSIIILILLRISCRKIIWVRHNFWPHDMPKRSPRQYLLLFFLRLMSTTIVTHRPVRGLRSVVVPHPLYDEAPVQASERDIEFLYFGLIKRYKGLDQLLKIWPEKRPLIIAGAVSDQILFDELEAIAHQRGLDVKFISRFLSNEELASLIGRTKFAVLPHKNNSMIVTGAFYHAASLGANVVIADGDFGQYAKECFKFANTFNDKNIESVLSRIEYCDTNDVRFAVQLRNGRSVCLDAWKNLLK